MRDINKSEMDSFKRQTLDKWLGIDLVHIANKLTFTSAEYYVSEELIYDSIRCLDYETSVSDEPSINYVITLMALMWEHSDHEKYDLRKIIVKFLSRIGYPTSAIIVDDDFDKNNCVFTSLESPIDQILTTLNQADNSVCVKNKSFLLTSFQKEIWNSMDSEKLIGISAPTSAGKSFVLLLKILEKLCKENFDVVYIVPTLSLVNQVSEDFNSNIQQLGIDNCAVSNVWTERDGSHINTIFVLTQEKAISAFSDERNKFTNDLVLIADEIQNIERIKEDNDERAKILYDTLNEFRYKTNVKQIIISGPRIEDIDTTGTAIFGVETKDISTNASPVLNLTYSVYKDKTDYYLKQYCSLAENAKMIKIINTGFIYGYGKKVYDNDYLVYLNNIVSAMRDQQNIVFSPTTAVARRIACNLDGNTQINPRLSELIAYYKETIHSKYSMCDTLEKSVAYHHGKLPDHVRRTLEIAIRNKWVSTIACTTTLLQGVNLPTQNIIIRNPYLYLIKRPDSAELSNYEMANLRGRAGRLLKDFIGRTFVLDESAFAKSDEYDQLSLFDDTTKELPNSYKERFDKYYENIEHTVSSDKPVDVSMSSYGDLVSYIRQSVLRYGDKAEQKMEHVGIKLSKEQVAAIILKLKELSVPIAICTKNRYWDPFVLDVIYKNYNGGIPNHPKEYGAQAKLDRMLKFLRDTPETNYMYTKHIPTTLQSGKGRSLLCSLCMMWSKEVSLYNILAGLNYPDDELADEIEKIIEVLQNTVSFKVPLLLKPMFDILNPDSSFISCMQTGAFNQVSKVMIEIGVPRECALYIKENYINNLDVNNKSDDEIEFEIRKELVNNKEKMPYWIGAQLNFLG